MWQELRPRHRKNHFPKKGDVKRNACKLKKLVLKRWNFRGNKTNLEQMKFPQLLHLKFKLWHMKNILVIVGLANTNDKC